MFWYTQRNIIYLHREKKIQNNNGRDLLNI